MSVNITIKQLRKTAAQWTSDNTVLGAGVLGFETDTAKYKIGDGNTAWNSLSYPSFGGGSTWGSITGTLSDQTDLQTALNNKYDASNPAGYITGISWGSITGTLSSQTDLQSALGLKANTADPTFTTKITTPIVRASDSGGLIFQSNNGTQVADFGAGGGSNATFSGGVTVTGQLAVDTNTLFVDAVNNRVGIGTSSPTQALEVNGTIFSKVGAGSGTTINGANTSRYTNFPGINTSAIYMSAAANGNDLFISYVGGSATSNINMYWNSTGHINTRGSLLLGAADGAATLAGTTARLDVRIGSTSQIGAIIQAAAGQTADLLQTRLSNGNTGMVFKASGTALVIGEAFSTAQAPIGISIYSNGAGLFIGPSSTDGLYLGKSYMQRTGAANVFEFYGSASVVATIASNKWNVAASASGGARFNWVAGVAPSSPVDGDMWRIGDVLYLRDGATTKSITFT